MEKLLLHITELASWVSSGRLTVNLSRLIDFSKNNNEYCFRQMLEEFGNVRPGDPEAYVIATLNTDWRNYLKESQNHSKALFQTIELEAVSDIQALTNDAAIRLGSQIERLAIKLTAPKFEVLWTDYQKQLRFDEAKEGAKDFVKLFKFPDNFTKNTLSLSNSEIESIYKNSFSIEQQKLLEECKGTAEYGLLEFTILLFSSKTDEWRQSDEDYQLLKSERQKFLSKKDWNSVTFLENKQICNLIQKLNNLSPEKLGLDPLALVSFYKHKAEFILNGQKINFVSLKKDIQLMLSLNLEESILALLNLLGVLIGLENLMQIKYNLNKQNYSIFDNKAIEFGLNELDPKNFILDLDLINKPIENIENQSKNIISELPQLINSENAINNNVGNTGLKKTQDCSPDLETSLPGESPKGVELNDEINNSVESTNKT
jgi:hypothetical protein